MSFEGEGNSHEDEGHSREKAPGNANGLRAGELPNAGEPVWSCSGARVPTL